MEPAMFARMIQLCSAFLLAYALSAATPLAAFAGNDGIVRVKSAYPMGETIERLKKDIADKASNSSMRSTRRSSRPMPASSCSPPCC
jgi:hypothetical protein